MDKLSPEEEEILMQMSVTNAELLAAVQGLATDVSALARSLDELRRSLERVTRDLSYGPG